MIERDRELIRRIDASMAEAARRSGDWVVCRVGCTECCRGEFEITALDAMRLRAGLAELSEEEIPRIRERAAAFDGEGACPLLEPGTGACLLYEWRPVTCRTFGPATRTLEDGGIAVCEKCYAGASAAEIAECAVVVDELGLEEELLAGRDGPGQSSRPAPLSVAEVVRDYCSGPPPSL